MRFTLILILMKNQPNLLRMAVPLAFQILRYCYNPDRLYTQLKNYTSNFPDAENICELMFEGDSCKGFDKWNAN